MSGVKRGISAQPIYSAINVVEGKREAAPPKALLKKNRGLSGLGWVNDRVAMALLRLPKHTEIKIPTDLSIVGYDDVDNAERFDLTTIHQPLAEIGAEAVRLLIDEIDGRRTIPPQLPAHHALIPCLETYLEAAKLGGDAPTPLFPTSRGRSGNLDTRSMTRGDGLRTIKRRGRRRRIT